MSQSVPLATIHKLLEACAAGHTTRQTTHAIKVTYNGKEYPTLPSYNDIELGHVRSMVRVLEINRECANRFIPNLFKIPKAAKDAEK
jgi:hypothetical protein